MTEALNKIISDLLAMRRDEAAGFMVMANSDDTMFEDCIRRLKELSASRPEERASYDPVSGKCRGDCDCSIGQTCKAYLVYKQRTMNSGGEKP